MADDETIHHKEKGGNSLIANDAILPPGAEELSEHVTFTQNSAVSTDTNLSLDDVGLSLGDVLTYVSVADDTHNDASSNDVLSDLLEDNEFLPEYLAQNTTASLNESKKSADQTETGHEYVPTNPLDEQLQGGGDSGSQHG